MHIQCKTFLVCLAVPLIIGGVSAFLTQSSMETFQSVIKPPLSPPGWLFPVVWTILYILMGIASYLAVTSENSSRSALVIYGIQLVFNFFWSLIFFNQEQYLFAFIWLVALWILVLITTILFYRITKPAGYLMIPYLLWVTFAGYLNFGIYLLNQKLSP